MRDSDEIYRQLFDSANDAIFVADIKTGLILDANNEATRLTGRSKEDIIGIHQSQLHPPEECDHYKEKFRKHVQSGRNIDFEAEVVRKDGVTVPVSISAKVMEFNGAKVIQGIFRDITDRRQAEKALKHRIEMEGLVALVSSHFIGLSPKEFDGGIDYALRIAGEHIGVDRSYIFVISADGSMMDNTHEWCAEGIEPQKEILQELSIEAFPWIMEKLYKFKNVYIPSVDALPPEAEAEKEILQAQDIKSLILVPMIRGNSLVGFLGFDSVRTERAWEDEDIRLLQTLGNIIVGVLDRQKAEEILRKSEEALHGRVKELNCLYEVSEIVNTCNDSLDKMLQWTADILPESLSYPEKAYARITLGDKEYSTTNFQKSSWMLSSDIVVAGEKTGTLEITYSQDVSASPQYQFLNEERDLMGAVAELIGRNIERIQAQQELQVERSALRQKNIALRELVATIRDEEMKIGREIVGNVDKIIMPIVHELEQGLPQRLQKYVNLLKESLEEIALPFANELSKEFASLTPTEIRICNLIRRELSTKEIAQLEHISPATASKHRENIRRKLAIRNKNINLSSFLANFMPPKIENLSNQ